MVLAPVAQEEDLAEAVDSWLDRMRRLELHGSDYRLPPLFKINALRMLMTGKAKEYFDMWESECDPQTRVSRSTPYSTK